jgi:hypothetical protein
MSAKMQFAKIRKKYGSDEIIFADGVNCYKNIIKCNKYISKVEKKSYFCKLVFEKYNY